ncbi:hypothetical protein AB0H49_24895 [Nocardia sp. NPDC050713]|uniref:hypothetical protein n=1 Tax=Nocardia sp. NPDC050713 TaxID=3154511 RepID=UPI0033F49872
MPAGDGFSEFAEELKLLAEAVLERVEPVLRRSAAQGQPDWSACSWCPVCAAAALVRGEHHDVVAAIADHGTAIVTVLREALAGVPVDPLLPDDEDAESGVGQRHPGGDDGTRSDARRGAGDGRSGAAHRSAHQRTGAADRHDAGSPSDGRSTATSRDGHRHGDASRSSGAHVSVGGRENKAGDVRGAASRSGNRHSDEAHSSGPRNGAARSDDERSDSSGAPPDQRTNTPLSSDTPSSARSKRSGYVGIPVTIKA